jgi:hypothetical protein
MNIFLKFLLVTLQGKVFLPIIFIILAIGLLLHSVFDINFIWLCIVAALIVIFVWAIFIVWKLKQRDTVNQVSEGAIDLNSISKRLIEAQRHHKINNDQWYLMIGSTNSGKTTLMRNSGLKFSYIDSSQRKPIEQGIESTRDCDFFQTDGTYESTESVRKKALIIDVTGAYMNERGIDGDAQTTQKHWLAFLHTLKRHSKKTPMKGLLLAVDLESIVQEEKTIEEQAKVINERIKDIISVFGVTLPIYLVFTKCDTMFGFTTFFDTLKVNKQDEVFGYTFSDDQQKDITNEFKAECERLFRVMASQGQSYLASVDEKSRSPIYSFPQEFNAISQKLTNFVHALFPKVSQDTPPLRGFYFTSATQVEENMIEFVLLESAKSFGDEEYVPWQPPVEQKKDYFVNSLFNKVIFPDRLITKPTYHAKRSSMIKRWVICGGIALISLILTLLFFVSYNNNKDLITDVQKASVSVYNMPSDMNDSDKNERLERMRKPIIQLERFSLLSSPWYGQRQDVADETRKLYLLKKYGSDNNWKSKLRRRVEIPVQVYNSDKDQPISKTKVEARLVKFGNKQIKKTNKKGLAFFRFRVEDGKAEVAFTTDHEEAGYQKPSELLYEIQPGDKVKTSPVQILFSKLSRLVSIQCLDASGKGIAGVPIAITKKSKDGQILEEIPPKETNLQGSAEFSIEASDGSMLEVNYKESPVNFSIYPDTLEIKSGEARYSVNKQMERKITITLMAFSNAEQPKPGVSLSVNGQNLGITDTNGQWTGVSPAVPSEQNIMIQPKPNSVKIDQTASGYSIMLGYGAGAVAGAGSASSGGGSPTPSSPQASVGFRGLYILNAAKATPRGVEIWAYAKDDDINIYNSLANDHQMEFLSGGKQIKLIKIDANVGGDGYAIIPKDFEEHDFLISHPDYWSQKVNWQQASKPIQMIGIENEQSIDNFDSLQKDGASYYISEGNKKMKSKDVTGAISYFGNSVRLIPTKEGFLESGLAYCESRQYDSAKASRLKIDKINLKAPESKTYQQKLKMLDLFLKSAGK